MHSKTLPQALRLGSREFLWGQRTYVMGIINVTPDSFSGDGLGDDVEAALAHALRFQDEGADILDVGGAGVGGWPPSLLRRACPSSSCTTRSRPSTTTSSGT